MKTASHFKITQQSALGVAALLVVTGIIFGLTGNILASGIFVGVGVLLASFAAFQSSRLTIW